MYRDLNFGYDNESSTDSYPKMLPVFIVLFFMNYTYVVFLLFAYVLYFTSHTFILLLLALLFHTFFMTGAAAYLQTFSTSPGKSEFSVNRFFHFDLNKRYFRENLYFKKSIKPKRILINWGRCSNSTKTLKDNKNWVSFLASKLKVKPNRKFNCKIKVISLSQLKSI